MTVACVLRSGGDYSPRWVDALARGIELHSPAHREDITCLTDMDVSTPGVRVLPLRHRWPGWWSKAEAFAPGLFSPWRPTLYLDLDSLVVGDLAPLLAYTGEFAMLSDFYRPELRQSGAMLFRPGAVTERIWERFSADPAANMRSARGDGEWLHKYAPPSDRLQDLYPGAFVSLKVHAKHAPPRGAAVLCFHGHPRPNDPKAGWAHRRWRELAA